MEQTTVREMFTAEQENTGYWVVKKYGIPIARVLLHGESMANEIVNALIIREAVLQDKDK